jgi:DNA polymerase III epsilon subunit-like protein
MPRLQRFVRGLPIVAHNAAFDRGFLHAELARAGLKAESEFLCTMRLARRLAPGLPSYRLDALVDALQVRAPNARQFHRSLADVNHTVAIWQNLQTRFTARRRVEHPDAQAEEAGAKVPGVVEGGEVLSLADKRGGLRLIILNGAHRANVLQLGDFNGWR